MKIINKWYNTWYENKECIIAFRAGDIYIHDRQIFFVVSAIKKPDVYDTYVGETGEGICLTLFNIKRSRVEYREQSIHTEYHFFKFIARSA